MAGDKLSCFADMSGRIKRPQRTEKESSMKRQKSTETGANYRCGLGFTPETKHLRKDEKKKLNCGNVQKRLFSMETRTKGGVKSHQSVAPPHNNHSTSSSTGPNTLSPSNVDHNNGNTSPSYTGTNQYINQGNCDADMRTNRYDTVESYDAGANVNGILTASHVADAKRGGAAEGIHFGHCESIGNATTCLDTPDQAPQNNFTYLAYKKHSPTLETDDLDMDTIVPACVVLKESRRAPEDVPAKFVSESMQRASKSPSCWSRMDKNSKQKSPIYILHSQATDDPKLGDKFGASVETLKSSSGDYHTHVIKDVEKGGVADSMKIRNGDQLVLMNGTFLPKLGHKNVLELFKNVPVDSHTRLSLVLRRFQKDDTSEWVTTSAILIAELAQEPAVKELRFATDPGTQKIWTHWYRLQIQGTQMFVMISQGQVGVEVGKNEDIPKYNICVRSKCEFDSHLGTYSYKACVSGIHHEDRNRDSYLTVKNDESICLNTQPQWFGFGLRGREMSFEDLDLRKYLACQLSNYGATGKLCVEDDRFTFQAIGIKGSYDHTDGHMNVYSEHDLRNSRSSNGSMETDESSSEPLSLTQSSILSHSSSLDSGSGSQTDSGYEGLSVRTSGFEEQDCHDILLETGGKHLSCKTPTTPMANLKILHGLGSTEHNP